MAKPMRPPCEQCGSITVDANDVCLSCGYKHLNEETLPEVERISVARLLPTDVLVFEANEHISLEAVERIKAYVLQVFPNHKAIVLDQGLRLKVLRAEDAAKLDT